MPDQPPTPSRVEELLRASAQRRRAEFDGEVGGRSGGTGNERPATAAMPAAMRRRLHEEILARRAGSLVGSEAAEAVGEREPDSPRVGLFALFSAHFWPRFALAAAAVVALLALPFFWRSSHREKAAGTDAVAMSSTTARPAERKETTAASTATSPVLQPTPPATVALAPAPPPALAAAPGAPGAAATPAASPAPEESTALAAAAASSPTPALAAAKPLPSLTLAEPNAGRSRPAEGLATATTKSDSRGVGGESGLRQSFARNELAATSRAASTTASRRGAADAAKDAANAGSGSGRVAAASPEDVLTNFQLEQTGDRVRIVDADGSVYTGEIQPLDATARAAAPRARPQDAAPSRSASAERRQVVAAPADRDAARASAAETAASGSGGKKGEDERAGALAATAQQRGRFAASGPPAAAPATRQRAAPESQPKPATAAPGGGLAQAPAQDGAQRPATSADVAQADASAAARKQEASTENRGDDAAVTTTGAAFSFRASGANVSLRKPVVFEGTYYPASGPDQAPAAEANLKLKKTQEPASRAKSAAATRAAQSQSRATTDEEKPAEEEAAAAVADAPRVIGRARVAGREVSVDASAVSR